MMKTRKWMQLAISLMLILCLLAGCSRGSDKVKDDTEPATTEAVTESEEAASDTHELVGTLEDITMDSLTLRLIDGRILTFNTNNVKHSFSYGITEGNWVTVIYSGELTGTDTSKIALIEIHDEDTDYVRSVKAQTKIDAADDTVYALETVVVRDSYMMASESVGTLKPGEAVKRTGHCNNGWDRITFKNKDAYVYGTLLTTNPDESGSKDASDRTSHVVKMKELNETVYAKTDATVRQGYSTAAKMIGALKAGTSVTRTGICDNGWSRINYNGLVGFVYSDLLTTKDPNSEKDGVKITAVSETVFIVVKEANVRKSWNDKSDIVGSMKYGDNIVRTGICDNGWSRVSYNKQDAYIRSDLLSKSKPADAVKIYKVNGYAWTVTKANVRESYSVESKILGELKKGEGIKITGVTDNNWSRVDYNGKVGFIHNDLLTSKDPNPPKPAPAPETKATETKAPETKATETKAPETKATETKAPETETKAPETKAPETETKAPETETKAPETETKAPETETKAPETETRAPETETQAPETETQAPETETAAPETESAAPETESAAPETESAAPETETAAPETETEAPDQHYIEGIVVGYDHETITILVENDKAGAGSSKSAEKANPDDEYPSITYEEAVGKEMTYYTFDIRNAAQSYKQGIDEGMIVRLIYTGSLKDISSVNVIKVTDEDIKQTTKTFRGSVVSFDKDILVIDSGEGVTTSFDCKKAEIKDKDKIAEGVGVRVIADLKDASKEDTVFKAVTVDIEK